jgi:hypothetical protein
MQTTTQKKKLSKAAWFLVFLLIGGLVSVIVLAAIGYISLQFLADGIVSYMAAGATSWMIGTLLIVLPFVGGMIFFWIVKTYFIGDKTKGVQLNNYTPQTGASTAASTGVTTEVS